MKNTEFLTVAEAAEYLGLKIPTIYAIVHQKRITHYKPNARMVLFKVSDLDAYLNKNVVVATDGGKND